MAGNRGTARVQARVTGRVQGVSYRWNTVRAAERLGLTGWVRNCRDGSVEFVAEGPRPALEDLVTWCETGPSFAAVDGIERSWDQATGEFTGFSIRY